MCDVGNYSTYNKSNFNKHKTTSKHQKLTFLNSEKETNVKEQIKNINNNKVKCEHSNKTYSNNSSLSRHKNYYCKLNKKALCFVIFFHKKWYLKYPPL